MSTFFNFFSGSDDEEEITERTVKVYKARRTFSDQNYRSLYRFSRVNVEFLANSFLEPYEETRGGALTNIEKMQTFLRYVGDPGFQVFH